MTRAVTPGTDLVLYRPPEEKGVISRAGVQPAPVQDKPRHGRISDAFAPGRRNLALVAQGPSAKRFDAATELTALRAAFDSPNVWSAVTRCMGLEDLNRVHAAAVRVNPVKADEITVRFASTLVKTLAAQPPEISKMFKELDPQWFRGAMGYTYVQGMGSKEAGQPSTFYDLKDMIPHYKKLGIETIYILPHYESPGGDNGYDISSFDRVRPELGGNEGYETFMKAANEAGLNVMSDAVFNHTSIEHEWFQKMAAGDPRYEGFYVDMSTTRKLGTHILDGRPFNIFETTHEDGTRTISKGWAIFTDPSREFPSSQNLLEVDSGRAMGWSTSSSPGATEPEKKKFWHTFYEFQPDLNLAHPRVLEELFTVLGNEANQGMKGKRLDAIPHFSKELGTDFENLDSTHAMGELFKNFFALATQGKGITMPEVGFGAEIAATYTGKPTTINGVPSTTEGDFLLSIEGSHLGLWHTLIFEDATNYWDAVGNLKPLPPTATYAFYASSHDEWLYFFGDKDKQEAMKQYGLDHGGKDFANRGIGIRSADLLDNDPQRISQMNVVLSLMPGVPVFYYGDEIGKRTSDEDMDRDTDRRAALVPDKPRESLQDTRARARGEATRPDIEEAWRTGYQPLHTIAALNTLRKERAAFRSNVVTRVASDRTDVLTLVKSDPKNEDRAVFAASNLTNKEVTVRMSLVELQEKLGLQAGSKLAMVDLLQTRISGEKTPVQLHVVDGQVELTLPPHASVIGDAGAWAGL